MLSRRKIEQYAKDREAKRAAQRAALLVPSRSLHKGTYAGGVSGESVPKSEPYRDPVLLEMAKDRPCLLCRPGQCACPPGSVVACHSNLAIHGKAKGRKADDCFTVWGGATAHAWLDQSAATKEKKEAAFMAAHLRQVCEWRQIAADLSEPERFRNAARRALERLNATPIATEPA